MGGNGPAAKVAAAHGIMLEPEADDLNRQRNAPAGKYWDEVHGEYRHERRRWPRDDGDDVRQAMHELADEVRGLAKKIGSGDGGGGAWGRHGITWAGVAGMLAVANYVFLDRVNERIDSNAKNLTDQITAAVTQGTLKYDALANLVTLQANGLTELAKSREVVLDKRLKPLEDDLDQQAGDIRTIKEQYVDPRSYKALQDADATLLRTNQEMRDDHRQIENRLQKLETDGTLVGQRAVDNAERNEKAIDAVNDHLKASDAVLEELRRAIEEIKSRFRWQPPMPESGAR